MFGNGLEDPLIIMTYIQRVEISSNWGFGVWVEGNKTFFRHMKGFDLLRFDLTRSII